MLQCYINLMKRLFQILMTQIRAQGQNSVKYKLVQKQTISFASKVLTPQQRKYCTTRKELLAIVVDIKQDQDKDLNKIKSWLRSEIEPSRKELALGGPIEKYFRSCKSQLQRRNNILYYLWEDNVNPRYPFVAPKNIQDEMLKYCYKQNIY